MSIYLHKHHIVPRHAGGTDDPSNLVELTVEDHAIAHKILYGFYGRWQDRVAWLSLSGMIGKEEIIFEMSRRVGKRNGMYGRTHTIESRKKISERAKGRTHTIETRKDMSRYRKGKLWYNNGIKNTMCYENEQPKGFVKGRLYSPSKETRSKISRATKGKNNPFYGKTHTIETRKRISEKKRKQID